MRTAEEIYKYFLFQLKKENTAVVNPRTFNLLINEYMLDWIKMKLPDNEFSQKRIDDLEAIKVLTDGIQYSPIPSTTGNGNIFQIPYEDKNYPPYLHGCSAQFAKAIEYIPSPTFTPLADTILPTKPGIFITGHVLRADNRGTYRDNPYRQPDDKTFVYFENRGNFIYVHTKQETLKYMMLEYYSYPNRIEFLPDPDPDDHINTISSFQHAQNKEITEWAVLRYLERVSDQRLQTTASISGSVPK